MKNLLLLGFTLLFYACSNDLVYENAYCLTNVHTIDAKDGLQMDQTVIISEGRILKIAPTASLSLAASNTIIDCKGQYMIPGLWDAHVHFAYIEDLAPRMFDLFLSYGVTSVRDTGGKLDFLKEWKQKAEQNPQDAPRVKIAGPLLDGMPNVYDGSPGRPLLSVGAGSVEEALSIANGLVDDGVDLIKAYEMLTPEQFKAVAKFAKEKGLKLTGHVPLSMDVISASNAGMSSMEHLRNLEMSCTANTEELLAQRVKMLEMGAEDLGGILRSRIHAAQRHEAIKNMDEAKTEAVLDVLLKNQTWQVPTMSLYNGSVRKHVARPDWRASFEYLPDSIAEKWNTGVDNLIAIGASENRLNYAKWCGDIVKRIHEKGIGIMAGTDCPIGFLTPGLSLHEELVILVESGLSPLAALESATLKPAEYFSMQNELGLIKEGYIADLVLLKSNPLENIANTQTIESIVKAGKYHSQEALETMRTRLREMN